MSELNAEDRKALANASIVLRFAVESGTDLDPASSLNIATGLEAAQCDSWTAKIAHDFWCSYGALCKAIEPVTVDCILIKSHPVAGRMLLAPWRPKQYGSIAYLSAKRFMFVLAILLFLIVPIQLYAWFVSNAASGISGFASGPLLQLIQINKDADELDRTTAGKPSPDWNADERTLAGKIKSDVQDELYKLAPFHNQAAWVDYITLQPKVAAPDLTVSRDLQWFTFVDLANTCTSEVGLHVELARGRATLLAGALVSFLLPSLFGLIGALAFVTRSISDQIRTTTFSSSSPIRHAMRVMLGGLMGVVIGLFNELSSQVSLSPLAIAFLAGYGVEGFFSLFDDLIGRVRQPTLVPADTKVTVRRSEAGLLAADGGG